MIIKIKKTFGSFEVVEKKYWKFKRQSSGWTVEQFNQTKNFKHKMIFLLTPPMKNLWVIHLIVNEERIQDWDSLVCQDNLNAAYKSVTFIEKKTFCSANKHNITLLTEIP